MAIVNTLPAGKRQRAGNLDFHPSRRINRAMQPLKDIVIVINRNKPGADALAKQLGKLAREKGVQCEILAVWPLLEEHVVNKDLCVVVGGDGTLLGVANAVSRCHIPVMGVNLGRLGFMASFLPAEVEEQFASILDGNLNWRDLTLLTCESAGKTEIALNDVVIKARSSQLIRLEVHCEEEHMNTYNADGIIFATPTGSTAYNLSAGGPIVHPSASVIVATPINPHTLSNRAIVLDDSHELTVHLLGDASDVEVSADGREIFGPVTDFPIHVRISPERRFRLVQIADYSHYYVLRSKLHWTGDAVHSIHH